MARPSSYSSQPINAVNVVPLHKKGTSRLSRSRPKRFSVWSPNASRPRGEAWLSRHQECRLHPESTLRHTLRQRGAQSVSKLDRRKLRQPILLVLSCTPPLRFAHGFNALPCLRDLTGIGSESFKLARVLGTRDIRRPRSAAPWSRFFPRLDLGLCDKVFLSCLLDVWNQP
jgi:hypothetical protein